MNAEVTASVIIIGNEILSGRTRDSNLSFIGRRLDSLGIHLLEACVIPDIERTIIKTVNQYREKFNFVFTTGGIGPTHDDITAMSVAKAFGLQLKQNPDAVKQLENYYEPGQINEARLKMALIPEGAILIKNPISGAPGFQVDNVFVLAGVPTIMEAMFEGITDRLVGGKPVLTTSVATNIGESMLAKGLGELQDIHPEISIGSYPYFKRGKLGVNIVLRSTDKIAMEQLHEQVKNLILSLGGSIVAEQTD